MRNRRVRILLIDDDEDDQLLFHDLISGVSGAQWTVNWQPTWEKGRDALLRDEQDICFLDNRVGKHTGLELLKDVVAAGSRTPIVLLTGYGEEHVDLEAMTAGAADYLVKDHLTPVGLEKCIRYAIHRVETLEKLREREAQVLMHDRLASVGLLASSLAHEIGTPLGVIRGRAEYLALQSRENEAVRKNADIIIAQIDRVSALIRSLLNLARGEGTPSSGEVLLNTALTDVIELMGHELRKNGIRVENALGTETPIKVHAESASLHQVFLNLLVNSVHAIGAAISVQGRNAGHVISISARDQEQFWAVEVKDTGCGISVENMRHLFKPFFTTKDIGVGTGLGLVTSYRIVENWGGTIQVESREGVGSMFRVLLPKYLGKK